MIDSTKQSINLNEIRLDPLDSNLFGLTAQKVAVVIHYEKQSKLNASTQLRRFYDELVMWNDRVQLADNPDAKYAELIPFIQMIRAKVAYAKGRGLIDDNFCSLMNCLLSEVKNVKTLNYAKLFLEAMMGFKKGLEK